MNISTLNNLGKQRSNRTFLVRFDPYCCLFGFDPKLLAGNAGLVVLMFWLGLGLFALAGAETIKGTVVGVTDGDTFTLLTLEKKQVKIRVAEIDAPEKGQPYSNRAQLELSRLIFQKEISVEVQVVDNFGRIVGRPFVAGQDVCIEMIRAGAAWVYRSYSDDEALYEFERRAKSDRQGLWSLHEHDQVPPWEWRHGGKKAAQSSSELEAFKCGAKEQCSQMVSCAEARYHLQKCGLTRIDGDGDGVPCEAMCR